MNVVNVVRQLVDNIIQLGQINDDCTFITTSFINILCDFNTYVYFQLFTITHIKSKQNRI